ncbi:plasmid stabilization protein [Pseudomonas sp. MWU12-2323]|uniref:plasmid stabilization protein n=1 Tax=Pseudomonas sp. MWU12-2323 TaxID=2651296 RepID=UPI002113FB8B
MKKNLMGAVAAGDVFSVVILNRNKPAFCSVTAKEYEAMLDRSEDIELSTICRELGNDPTIKVSLDDL